jgi:hypothetical protein
MQAAPILEQEFLPLRAKLLEIAAALDRLDRGDEMNPGEPRLQKIRAAIEVLREGKGDRAERLQLVFSREYEDDWRAKFGLAGT